MALVLARSTPAWCGQEGAAPPRPASPVDRFIERLAEAGLRAEDRTAALPAERQQRLKQMARESGAVQVAALGLPDAREVIAFGFARFGAQVRLAESLPKYLVLDDVIVITGPGHAPQWGALAPAIEKLGGTNRNLIAGASARVP
jgi:hypothetical protein